MLKTIPFIILGIIVIIFNSYIIKNRLKTKYSLFLFIFFNFMILPMGVFNMIYISPHALVLDFSNNSLEITFPKRYKKNDVVYNCKYSENTSFHVKVENYNNKEEVIDTLVNNLSNKDYILASVNKTKNEYLFKNGKKGRAIKYKILIIDNYILKILCQTSINLGFDKKYHEIFFNPVIITK